MERVGDLSSQVQIRPETAEELAAKPNAQRLQEIMKGARQWQEDLRVRFERSIGKELPEFPNTALTSPFL